jgi:hypothetical protein
MNSIRGSGKGMAINDSISASQSIGKIIDILRTEGAGGLDQYEERLKNNAGNDAALNALLCEARVAKMFLHNGFQVVMRERPDLQIRLDEETVYIEVKYFREKEQDRLDDEAMEKTTDLMVLIGDLVPTEGMEAWRQIVRVALRKVDQYVDSAPNILVVVSDSGALIYMAQTAVHEYNDQVANTNDPRLQRLNGIMLVNSEIGFGQRGPWNVEFHQTANPTVPLSKQMAACLESISRG